MFDRLETKLAVLTSDCRTVQQVLGTQVDVDAAVEPRDESVENSLL